MSGGRWERQSNGDYQHFTDEEIEENYPQLKAMLCKILNGLEHS